jgi:phosphoribosylanthranilate isomerase
MKTFFQARPGEVKVKICGVTNGRDAWAAIAAGADAVGINVWPDSKRYVAFEEAQKWMAELAGAATRIVIAVNPTLAEARRWLSHPAVDALQLHGEEEIGMCEALMLLGKPVIKAIRVRTVGDVDQSLIYPVQALLFDAYHEDERGGTGKRFDWSLLAGVPRERRTILSGGLTPANVAAAISAVAPFAVDVASGVERLPREKDPAKMRAFVAAAKQCL